jgi:hypothetical protein
LKSCEKFDLKLKKWVPIPDMMTTRSNFSALVVEDTIMVVGGFNGFTTSELVECFDPTLNCWCSSSDLQVHRSALSVCLVLGSTIPQSSLEAYAYPNRDKLPEEKRMYERSLENVPLEEMEDGNIFENDDVGVEVPDSDDDDDETEDDSNSGFDSSSEEEDPFYAVI